MDNQSIFSEVATDKVETPPVVAPTPTAFSIPTEASELIGDGKKYKSAEDALKALPHSQSHILRLEEENKQIREELAKRKAAEELLNEMKQINTIPQATPASVEADPEVLSQIVERVIEKKSAQQAAQQNAKSVVEKLTAVYGDKAKEQYYKIAESSGMDIATLDILARQSPSAVLKLAGIDSNKSIPKLQGDVITSNLGTDPSPKTSRVPAGATSKDMAAAFKVAREEVLKKYN